MTKYVVTAPYVTFKAKDPATGAIVVREMYQGGVLPDEAEPENVARLVEKGMIAEQGSREADLLGVPAGTPIPGEPPNVPVTEQSPASITPADRLKRAQDAQEAAEKAEAKPKKAAEKPAAEQKK